MRIFCYCILAIYFSYAHMHMMIGTLPTRGFDLEFLYRSLMWCGMEPILEGVQDDVRECMLRALFMCHENYPYRIFSYIPIWMK